MKFLIATSCAILFVMLHLSNAAPVPSATSRTPCKDRHQQVRKEVSLTGTIESEPRYVPECDISGRYWMPAQCSSTDRGFCFCVDPETGARRAGALAHFHPKEQLDCVYSALPNETRICQHRQNQYNTFKANFGTAMGNVLEYNPVCLKNGSFEAMQRDSLSFFCVDTVTGRKIPNTEKQNLRHRPLIESVCQAYSKEWRNFLDSLTVAKKLTTDHEKHVVPTNASSCDAGMEFMACGCPRMCQPGTNMEEFANECSICKPVCSCPQGRYEFNGTCLTNDECMAAKLPEESHEIVDLTALWEEYQVDYPNADIQAFLLQTGEYSENNHGLEYSPQEGEEGPTQVEEVEEIVEVVEKEESTLEPEEVLPTEGESETPVDVEEEEVLATESTKAVTTTTAEEFLEEMYVDMEEELPTVTTTKPPAVEEQTEGPEAYYNYEEEQEEEEVEMTSSPESSLLFELLRNAVEQERALMKVKAQVDESEPKIESINQQLESVLEEGDEVYPTDPSPSPTSEQQNLESQEFYAELETLSLPIKKSASGTNSSSS